MKVINVDEEGRVGGPERRIANVAGRLTEIGIKTTVIIPVLDGDFFKEYLDSLCVDHVALDITRLSLERNILLRYVFRFPIEILTLYKFFIGHQATIVHVNGAYQFKVALAAKFASKRVIWHLNNTHVRKSVGLVFNVVSKLCADAIIFAGSRAGNYYRVKTRFNGFPQSCIEAPVGDKFFEINPIGMVSGFLNLVVIGGVNPDKGLDDLITVVGKLKKRGIPFKLRIAGKLNSSQIKYRKSLSELEFLFGLDSSDLAYLGEVNDVPKLLETSDICISMSKREASPTAVWEGLASGRVVVSTDVGSVGDYIVYGENGFLVPVGACDDVVQILVQLSRGEINTEAMAARARTTALKNFHLSRIAEKHHEIYKKVDLL